MSTCLSPTSSAREKTTNDGRLLNQYGDRSFGHVLQRREFVEFDQQAFSSRLYLLQYLDEVVPLLAVRTSRQLNLYQRPFLHFPARHLSRSLNTTLNTYLTGVYLSLSLE